MDWQAEAKKWEGRYNDLLRELVFEQARDAAGDIESPPEALRRIVIQRKQAVETLRRIVNLHDRKSKEREMAKAFMMFFENMEPKRHV